MMCNETVFTLDNIKKGFNINYMQYPSKEIVSNQNGIHENLTDILEKHRISEFKKPFSRHTLQAFENINTFVQQQDTKIILDSGCGVGESTINLAKLFPDSLVIGIDKSFVRLDKNSSYAQDKVSNFRLVRADLLDFWRLAVQAKWNVDKHFILYPNPWPKKQDVKKRFYAHPVFWDLIKLGKVFELRSNWKLYLEEFSYAFCFATGKNYPVQEFIAKEPMTPFERKFTKSEHILYKLVLYNE